MINRADYSRATSTTVVGTTSTAVAGLSKAVVAGTYKFEAWMQIDNVGSPTNVNFCVTGPATSACNFEVGRGTATTLRNDSYTAFANASAGTAVVAVWAKLQGTFVATVSGTIQVAAIRVAGTSSTVRVGAYLECKRIG